MKIFQIFNNYNSRYQEEFLELAEIASGEFGVVKKARHRLDGMIYAIKVSKKAIRKNSHDEKMAMNEVFAHAALMKHKHVVRYYNSWVENGAVSFKYFLIIYCDLIIFLPRFSFKMSTAREAVCRGRLRSIGEQESGSRSQS